MHIFRLCYYFITIYSRAVLFSLLAVVNVIIVIAIILLLLLYLENTIFIHLYNWLTCCLLLYWYHFFSCLYFFFWCSVLLICAILCFLNLFTLCRNHSRRLVLLGSLYCFFFFSFSLTICHIQPNWKQKTSEKKEMIKKKTKSKCSKFITYDFLQTHTRTHYSLRLLAFYPIIISIPTFQIYLPFSFLFSLICWLERVFYCSRSLNNNSWYVFFFLHFFLI